MAPSAADQLLLQELNLARANPAAYGASIGLNLASVAPAQPLAFDADLIDAATLHSEDMSNQGYFAHDTPQGVDPGERLTEAGFDWSSWGESIAGGTAYPGPSAALQALIIDAGVPDLGHRVQLLAMQPMYQTQNMVGIGALQGSSGPLVDYYTIDTASPAVPQAYITGVVFNDLNGSGQYVIGSGMGGVTISIAGGATITTWDSGGYSIPVAPGTYTVSASGRGLATPITRTVTVGAGNVELNFSPQDDAFIQKLYQTDLGRSASNAEVANWEQTLQGWGGRAAVVAGIADSPEAQTLIVNGWYSSYLGRVPRGGEQSNWVNLLLGGTPREQVLSKILSSQEFYNRTSTLEPTGNANESFVEALYATLLNRKGSALDIGNLTAALNSVPRSAVVLEFLDSLEFRADTVTSYYLDLLYRTSAPSSAEIASWATSALDLADIYIGFESSLEFFVGN